MRRVSCHIGACCAVMFLGASSGPPAVQKERPAKSDDSEKKKAKADPELVALQKQLDTMTLPKLRELWATERLSYDHWRQQNNIAGDGSISPRAAATPDVEKSLLVRSQAWRDKLRVVERTLDENIKDDREYKALAKQLDGLSLSKLRELLATERNSFERWRDNNAIASTGELTMRIARPKDKELDLQLRWFDWSRKIRLINAAIGGIERASRGSEKEREKESKK